MWMLLVAFSELVRFLERQFDTILAVDKTLVRSFDVTSQTQLFRVVQLN